MAQVAPPFPENLLSLQETVQELGQLIKDPNDLDPAELPGLEVLIDDWFNDDVDVSEEDFTRRILTVFRDSTHGTAYVQVINKLPPKEKSLIEKFTAGKTSIEDAAKLLADKEIPKPPSTESRVQIFSQKVAQPQKRNIRGQENNVFENWGRTVKNTPAFTYYPENVKEVQTIVRESVKNKRGVRVAGFRHSWAPVFGRNNKAGQKSNGDVLISTLTEHNATVLPNFTSLPGSLFQPRESELNNISVVDAAYVKGQPLANGKKYVRVGTATTNEQFRRWCIQEGKVTLPVNIIEVEITMGGSNATICHGAGLAHPTLSDFVRAIEYVDVNGEIRTVNMANPELLKAASGCFGLLGVVTHIVLECEAISTAVMRPMKLDVIEAIPPPAELKESDIPPPLRKSRTPEQRRIDQQNFERRANSDFYAEWFWFPYSSKAWVNTWSTDASTKDVVNYPSTIKTVFQVFGTAAMNMAQIVIGSIGALQTKAYMQTAFLSWVAMKNMDEVKDNQKSIRTLLPNALHYQRGVQNIRVRNLEVELPLHAKKGSTTDRDYTNVQRAWWDAIITCYANAEKCPMRMPLEMRIMGSSTVTMAPQRGNTLGTCAIGILTLKDVADTGIWEPYAQDVLDKWGRYQDNDGKRIVVRPHWAKEWDNLKVGGRPWREVLKNETYKNEIVEFKALLAKIGEKDGWTLGDVKRTFSNEILDYLFLDDVTATEGGKLSIKQDVTLEKKVPVVVEREIKDTASVVSA